MQLTERFALQCAIALGGLVPVLTGSVGVVLGTDMLGQSQHDISLDNHFRYLSGLLLGLGLTFWYAIPRIEHNTRLCRALTLLVVLGGLARLIGIVMAGVPDMPMLLAIGMELVVTPLLCLWQARIARLYGDAIR